MKPTYKTLGLAITLACLSFCAAAQKHVVYLKDHNVLRGKILKLDAKDSLYLRLNAGNTLVIALKKIDSIRNDSHQQTKFNPLNKKGHFYGEYFLGGESNGLGMGIYTEYLRQLDAHFSLGAGAGFMTIFGNLDLAVFTDLQYKISKARISPCISTKIGYSIAEDSYFVSPGIGIAFRKPKNRSLSLLVGFNIREGKHFTHQVIDPANSYYVYETGPYGTTDLKIGYSF